MKKILGGWCIKIPFTRDKYLVWDDRGLVFHWLAHSSDGSEFWTQCDWMRDKEEPISRFLKDPIDLAVFKPVDKPVTFTEEEREHLRRLQMSEERSRLFLEEEGANITIGGPNDTKLHEEAVKRFNAKHPEFGSI